MIAFFPTPFPVHVIPLGVEGYAIYVDSQGMWSNDLWCCQLDDGRILHFSTNQLRGVVNGTYGIAPTRQTDRFQRFGDVIEYVLKRAGDEAAARPTPPERPGNR